MQSIYINVCCGIIIALFLKSLHCGGHRVTFFCKVKLTNKLFLQTNNCLIDRNSGKSVLPKM